MPLIELTAAEEKIVHAARGYADALAVLRGNPPFSTWDALRVTAKRDELLSEALKLSGEREVGPSIPADAPAPPDLVAFMNRLSSKHSKVSPKT